MASRRRRRTTVQLNSEVYVAVGWFVLTMAIEELEKIRKSIHTAPQHMHTVMGCIGMLERLRSEFE